MSYETESSYVLNSYVVKMPVFVCPFHPRIKVHENRPIMEPFLHGREIWFRCNRCQRIAMAPPDINEIARIDLSSKDKNKG